MGDFKRKSFGGGDRKSFGDKKSFAPRGGSGGSRSFDRGSRPDREMFTTECEKCHKSCQVPFKPNGDKPVYCNDCFSPPERSAPSDRGGRDDTRSFDRGSRGNEARRPAAVVNTTESVTFQFEALKKQMSGLSEKIDAISQALNVSVTSSVKKESARGLKGILKGVKDHAEEIFEDVAEVVSDKVEKASKKLKEQVDSKEDKPSKKKPTTKKVEKKPVKKEVKKAAKPKAKKPAKAKKVTKKK